MKSFCDANIRSASSGSLQITVDGELGLDLGMLSRIIENPPENVLNIFVKFVESS